MMFHVKPYRKRCGNTALQTVDKVSVEKQVLF